MEDPMTRQTTALALAFCLAMMSATTTLAQDSTVPAPATEAPATAVDDLSLGNPEPPAADGPGTTYVPATFDAWEQRCIRTEDGSDPCQLYQLLKDAEGNSVAEISIFGLPPGQKAAAGATIVVPLETLLTEQLTLAVDSGAAKRYPLTWCASVGCFARVGFTPEELTALKRGNTAAITIVPVAAPTQKVTVEVSLKGFTAGFDAVNAANAP